MKRKTRTKARKSICAPSRKKSFTCYSNSSLEKLRRHWNQRHPDMEISSGNKRHIWAKLNEGLQNTCANELCWYRKIISEGDIGDELKLNTFAPMSPKSWKKNPNTWLTSVDIEAVMRQHEKANHEFEFIGPSPIDFDTKKTYGECVWNELCHFDLGSKIKNNKTKLGVIFNTDPHYLGGSHWVALFIDTNKKAIMYFDSTGDNIPREIKAFANKVKKQASKQLADTYSLLTNKTKHQTKNTECGMYCLYFIIYMLKGGSFAELAYAKNRIPDEKMNSFRRDYYNDYEKF